MKEGPTVDLASGTAAGIAQLLVGEQAHSVTAHRELHGVHPEAACCRAACLPCSGKPLTSL